MTTLRILLPDAPHADRADAWALFGDDGRMVREGRDVPAAWPAAARVEAVIAAQRTRLVTLSLPPLTPDRLPAAVAYALEDQLAAGAASPRIAIGPQRADGRVVAAIADAALIARVEDAASFARIVPESALPEVSGDWSYCRSAAGDAFVVTPDGAFAVTRHDSELPPELTAALAQARRVDRAPPAVRVAFDVDAAALARYGAAAGLPFVRAEPWRWTGTPPSRYADAPDWRAPTPVLRGEAQAARAAWFRPAVVLAAAALALHVGATLVQWGALHWNAWRIGRDTVALARTAGVADATTPAAASAGLVRAYADARHRAGLAAPGDALPLLAQAAPALGLLPPGTLKTAVYGDGAWTLDLGKVDADVLTRVDRTLGTRGVAVLQAPTAAGSRLRITATP